jgi:hypothetical protein
VQAAIFDEGAVLDTHLVFRRGAEIRVTKKTQKSPRWCIRPKSPARWSPGAKTPPPWGSPRMRLFSYDFERDLDDLKQIAKQIQVSNHSYVSATGWHQNPGGCRCIPIRLITAGQSANGENWEEKGTRKYRGESFVPVTRFSGPARRRVVDSSPRLSTISWHHTSLPKRWPRSKLRRITANSWLPSVGCTRADQSVGRRVGDGQNRSRVFSSTSVYRQMARSSSERAEAACRRSQDNSSPLR